MEEQAKNPAPDQNLSSFEGDLFGAIFGFHLRVVALLRESSLSEQQLEVVGDRLKAVIHAIGDMKQTKNINLHERLESAYEEAQRLVNECSKSA